MVEWSEIFEILGGEGATVRAGEEDVTTTARRYDGGFLRKYLDLKGVKGTNDKLATDEH